MHSEEGPARRSQLLLRAGNLVEAFIDDARHRLGAGIADAMVTVAEYSALTSGRSPTRQALGATFANASVRSRST